jgi:hypothetical protein
MEEGLEVQVSSGKGGEDRRQKTEDLKTEDE